MPDTAPQPTKPPPSIPCPADGCENGSVWWQDTSLGSGRGRATPREGYSRCERCDGCGVLDSWECGTCNRDHVCSDEMPAWQDGDTFQCRACLRDEVLAETDVASLAKSLRAAVQELGSAVPTSIDTPYRIGLASGAVAVIAEQLEQLARNLGGVA